MFLFFLPHMAIWLCQQNLWRRLAQLGRPDFATCKIQWKHIAQSLNLATHFASSKTLIFNKGFSCTKITADFRLQLVTCHMSHVAVSPNSRTTCRPLSLLCRDPESCEGVKSKNMDAFILNIQSYLKTTPLSYAKIPRSRAQLTLESLKNSRLNSQVVCRLQLAASNRSIHIWMSLRGGAR